jgi:hypothetical protein
MVCGRRLVALDGRGMSGAPSQRTGGRGGACRRAKLAYRAEASSKEAKADGRLRIRTADPRLTYRNARASGESLWGCE